MSLDATIWAWKVPQKQKKGGSLKPLKKLVLLSLADRASEDHCAYPSMIRLVKDTEMDRKTVIKIIDELIDDGLIIDTGERKGRTKQVKVYQLLGIEGRESIPTTVFLNDENEDLKSPNNGTVPTTEQFQQLHERVPTIPSKSPNVGTRNLSMNLSMESKNKKGWLCLKKLREEIILFDSSVNFENLILEKWYQRELNAFESFNAENNLCDDLMIYHFADWLMNARAKYARQKISQPKSMDEKPLTASQIKYFAKLLSEHSEFASNFIPHGYDREQSVIWIANKLRDPAQVKQWEGFLGEVGFNGKIPKMNTVPVVDQPSATTPKPSQSNEHKPVKIDVKAMLKKAQTEKIKKVDSDLFEVID